MGDVPMPAPHVPGWPDEDRADAALERVLLAAHARTWPAERELSPGELSIVNAASHGLTNEEIAVVYGISLETVRSGMRGAMRKLAAKTRAHAVANALRRGLIS